MHRNVPRAAAMCFVVIALIALSATAWAQQKSSAKPTPAPDSPGGDLATQANDPTAALKQLQFLNSYSPSYYGQTGEGNSLNLRPVLPARVKGINTITRPTLQINSTPNGRTGLGDTVFLSIAIFEIASKIKFGVGPIFIAPSATNGSAGEGKWQLGPSIILIDARHKGLLLGVLEQNPISFAGESKREDVNQSLLQPVIVKKLPDAYFIRIDPTMTFNWEHGRAASIPVNCGFGRLFKLGTRPINAYVEPEWNVHRPSYAGSVTPRFTMRFSLTLLFPPKA